MTRFCVCAYKLQGGYDDNNELTVRAGTLPVDTDVTDAIEAFGLVKFVAYPGYQVGGGVVDEGMHGARKTLHHASVVTFLEVL